MLVNKKIMLQAWNSFIKQQMLQPADIHNVHKTVELVLSKILEEQQQAKYLEREKFYLTNQTFNSLTTNWQKLKLNTNAFMNLIQD